MGGTVTSAAASEAARSTGRSEREAAGTTGTAQAQPFRVGMDASDAAGREEGEGAWPAPVTDQVIRCRMSGDGPLRQA